MNTGNVESAESVECAAAPAKARLTCRQAPPRQVWQLEKAGLPPLLARLYAARGVSAASELDYALKALLPPQLLRGADAAAALLADALEAGARILIVADYDCDGATACALAVRALRSMAGNDEGGAVIDYLVPDRMVHGYGLSPSVVDLAAARAPDLIVTVDNGIASHAGVMRAHELGIAVLVTDHHLPGATLPPADCIVNPNQPDCAFPAKATAGVGVIFYVMLALRAELRSRGWFAAAGIAEPKLVDLLDLVALGTVADVVRLEHNNRILVSQGLRRVRQGLACPGIAALFAAAGREVAKATVDDFGFMIGPRINAAGRLADMALGIECLLSDDPARALGMAQKLDELNRQRRQIEGEMHAEALGIIEQIDFAAAGDQAGVALFAPNWHQGVVGIVASRLKDRLHRPVFAFARSGGAEPEAAEAAGELRGSGRSIAGLHLRDALDLVALRAPGLLKKFGGHAAAAGVTIAEADFPAFCQHFAAVAGELLAPEDLAETIVTDGELEASWLSLDSVRLLDSQIWGQGFPPPLFSGVFTVEQVRVVKEKHLRLRLALGSARLEAIFFNAPELPPSRRVRAAYRLAINGYRGVESLQLIVSHLQAVAD